MREIGDEAAVELVQLDERLVGFLITPDGTIALCGGDMAMVMALRPDELRALAGRLLVAAEMLEMASAPVVGHA